MYTFGGKCRQLTSGGTSGGLGWLPCPQALSALGTRPEPDNRPQPQLWSARTKDGKSCARAWRSSQAPLSLSATLPLP